MQYKIVRVFLPDAQYNKIADYISEVGTANEAQLYSVVDTSLGYGIVIDPDYQPSSPPTYKIVPINRLAPKAIANSIFRPWKKAIPILSECYKKYSGKDNS